MKRQTYPEANHNVVGSGVTHGYGIPQDGVDRVRRVGTHTLNDIEGVLLGGKRSALLFGGH